jgi:hypothetical protein
MIGQYTTHMKKRAYWGYCKDEREEAGTTKRLTETSNAMSSAQEKQLVTNWYAAGGIITELVYKIIITRLASPLHSDDVKT